VAIATDDFNRADGGLGANWTTAQNQLAPLIVSNVVQPNAVGSTESAAFYTATSFSPNQYSQVVLVQILTDFNRHAGVLLRCQAGVQTYYEIMCFGALGTTCFLTIDKYVSASSTALASGSALVTINPNDVLRASVDSTHTIRITVNGVSAFAPTTDASSPIASGQPGINVHTSANLTTDSKIDNWEGGDLAPGPSFRVLKTRPGLFKPGNAR
jgi:hypothetical protein